MSPRLPTVPPELRERLALLLAPVSRLGWSVLVGAVGCWLAAWSLGWIEFAYAAVGLAMLFGLSCLLTLGRTTLEVTLRVQPTRVRVGDSAVAEVRIRNNGRFPLPPIPLELATGSAATTMMLPLLTPGSDHEDLVILPTSRRGVYPIGPATTLRGDPFGLIRRALQWTEPIELFVHPRTIYVDGFTTGVLRDLEGHTTNDVSASDLAFHGLREYVPGDDRRHIHWLSTAKRSRTAGQTDLMVRQFLDTRRTHVGVVVDSFEGSYADLDDFETVLEIGASIAQRAVRDKVDVSVGSGRLLLRQPRGSAAMDLFARAELSPDRVDLTTARMVRLSPSMSTVVVVTGPAGELPALHRALAALPPGVAVLVLQLDPGAELHQRRSSGALMMTIGSLADLPRALVGRPGT